MATRVGEKRIKFSGAGLFWAGQAPKFQNSGRGVPWRKFWIGYHARSTTAISSGFLSFQVGVCDLKYVYACVDEVCVCVCDLKYVYACVWMKCVWMKYVCVDEVCLRVDEVCVCVICEL